MPSAFDAARKNAPASKKEEEGGLLNNIMSAGEFLRPDKLLPAFAQAGIQQSKAGATALAGAIMLGSGGIDEERLKRLDESKLSFMTDTENLRKQRDIANTRGGAGGIADKINAAIGTVSPVFQNVQFGFANTGLRGGAALGSGITQTGLAGPRITPNEAAEMLGVESYGQAAQKGQAGSLLLGDILNVAPALKGAGVASKANPLANTAAGARIAEAGSMLERAPLAPYSVPAKSVYRGVQRATVDATAFPKLAGIAEKNIPVASKLASGAEGAAQWAGDKWAGAAVRAEGLKQQGLINRSEEYALPLSELETNIKAMAKEGADEATLAPLLEEYQTIQNQAKAEALRETKYSMVRWADEQARKLGVAPEKLQPTNAFGRIVQEVDDELAQQVTAPGLSSLEEFPEAMSGISRKTAPAVEAEALRPRGIPAEGGQVGSAGRRLEQDIKKAYPDIEAGFTGKVTKAGDKVPAGAGKLPEGAPVTPAAELATRNIPENFTDRLIESHMKGLDAPALPKGLGGKALQGYDTLMKTWKDQVLALRPAWHTTNMIGNAMGAMMMGEVSPIWFAKNAKRVMEEAQNPAELTGMAMGRGIGAEALAENVGKAPKGGKVRQGYGKAVEKSYKFNQGVDDFMHTAVALNKLDELLANGVPYAEARNAAESFSLKTMGDFGNMSAGERAIIRRVSPFYPWYKHQAKATLRFPMENPARFAQSQAWGNRVSGGGNEAPEGAEFLRRFAPLGGGKFLSVGGDIGVGDPTNSPIFNPSMAIGALTPAAQLPLAAAGIDPRKGGKLEAAPGQSKLSAAAGYLLNQSATTKLGADVADQLRGQGGIVRGSTRAPIVADGRPIADSKVGGPLLPFLTGLSIQEPDLRSAAKREKKKQKTEKSKEKSYNKAVKKKPKK